MTARLVRRLGATRGVAAVPPRLDRRGCATLGPTDLPDQEYTTCPSSGTFAFRGLLYDAAEYKLDHHLGDTPSFEYMGPGYVWVPDGLRVEPRQARREPPAEPPVGPHIGWLGAAGVSGGLVGMGLAVAAAVWIAPPAPEHVHTSYQWFTVVSVTPPKHFRVDLRDSVGTVHWGVPVSKHCDRWRELSVGARVYLRDILERRPRTGELVETVVADPYQLCPGY